MPENTVKVCRPGKYGNPFRVVDEQEQHDGDVQATQGACVDAYRHWITGENSGGSNDHPPSLEEIRRDLAGKNLACWCKPGTPCHADVLLEIANDLTTIAPGGTPLAALNALESVIAGGLRSFVAVGQALAEIRDGKLYHPEYKTFEAYCAKRWQIGRAYAYQQIEASVTATALSAMADMPTPTAERQVRPLSILEPEDQKKAWQAAVQDAGGKVPTASLVEKAVREILPPKPKEPPPEPVPEHAAVLDGFRQWLTALPAVQRRVAWTWVNTYTRGNYPEDL